MAISSSVNRDSRDKGSYRFIKWVFLHYTKQTSIVPPICTLPYLWGSPYDVRGGDIPAILDIPEVARRALTDGRSMGAKARVACTRERRNMFNKKLEGVKVRTVVWGEAEVY